MPEAVAPHRISVVIPTYNRAELVFRTIDSVLAQTDPDFEVIVVDDGSTDDTARRFAAFSHPRVRYFRKDNGERGAARNFGARHSTGGYLTFFDSDDLMLPEHLTEARRAIEALGHPEVFALGYRFEDSGGRVQRTIRGLPDPLGDLLLEGNVLGCNPVFVRRDVFEANPFDETRELAGTEDWLLWLKLSARYPFRFRDRVTSVLVDHEGRSVRNFKEDKLEARSRILLERLAADPVFMKRYGHRLAELRSFRHVYTGLHLALMGQIGRPLVHLGRAALVSPRGLFRRATLGTLKHVALNMMKGRS